MATSEKITDRATTPSIPALMSRVWGIARMWPSIQRGATTSVLRFDLEHFKRLNDERGLAAVLLRDTTLEAGLRVADRSRMAIADLGLPHSGMPTRPRAWMAALAIRHDEAPATKREQRLRAELRLRGRPAAFRAMRPRRPSWSGRPDP